MGIHSKVWGQYLWRLLHCLTYSYHPKLSSEIKAKYIRLFHVLKDFIPCPVCRSHYTTRCNRNPHERNMSSTDQFVIWLSNINNEVNAGLGKPLIGKRQSDIMYVKNGKVNFDIRDFIVLFRIMTMINYAKTKTSSASSCALARSTTISTKRAPIRASAMSISCASNSCPRSRTRR